LPVVNAALSTAEVSMSWQRKSETRSVPQQSQWLAGRTVGFTEDNRPWDRLPRSLFFAVTRAREAKRVPSACPSTAPKSMERGGVTHCPSTGCLQEGPVPYP